MFSEMANIFFSSRLLFANPPSRPAPIRCPQRGRTEGRSSVENAAAAQNPNRRQEENPRHDEQAEQHPCDLRQAIPQLQQDRPSAASPAAASTEMRAAVRAATRGGTRKAAPATSRRTMPAVTQPWRTIRGGVLLLLTLLRRNPSGELTASKSLLVGVAQAAAMIPGISRSGSTICTALYQNVQPEKAANFSFLMLLPVVGGATLLKAFDVVASEAGVGGAPSLTGTIVAYVSGVVAIRLLLGVIRRGHLQWFALYCFAAAVAGLVWI